MLISALHDDTVGLIAGSGDAASSGMVGREHTSTIRKSDQRAAGT
jgi:hypothetical protein